MEMITIDDVLYEDAAVVVIASAVFTDEARAAYAAPQEGEK
jgi:hypothetical protein